MSVPRRIGKNSHINTWIYVILCGNKSWREKNVWFYLFIFFVGLDAKKESEVESRDECEIGSRARDDNPVSPDLTFFYLLLLAIIYDTKSAFLVHMVAHDWFFL